MTGKNNFANKMQAEAERRPHYGIRKFSVGVASVLLSTSLYFGVAALNSNNVLAATSNETETQETKKSDTDESDGEKETTLDLQGKGIKVGQSESEDSKLQNGGVRSAYRSEETGDSGDSQNDDQNNLETDDNTPVSETPEAKEAIKKASHGLTQVAVKDEKPALDMKGILTSDQTQALADTFVDFSDPESYHLAWKQEPDVSKLGQTSGIANVRYTDYDGNPGNFDITVPVTVVSGIPIKQDQVRNTLNVIDGKTNKIIETFSWIGKKTDTTEGQDDASDDNMIPEFATYSGNHLFANLSMLGYQVPDEATWDVTEFGTFANHSKVKAVVVMPKTDAPTADLGDGSQGSFSDYIYIHQVDPEDYDAANFVYGLGQMEPNETAVWAVKPKFKFTPDPSGDGSTDVDVKLLNTPVINIIKDGKVVKTFASSELNQNIQERAFDEKGLTGQRGFVKGIINTRVGVLPDPANAISSVLEGTIPTTSNITKNIKKYYNVKWNYEPYTKKPGYSYGFLELSLNDEGQKLMDEGKFNPDNMINQEFGILVHTGDMQKMPEVPKAKTKTVKQTIHYVDSENKTLSPDNIQSVTFIPNIIEDGRLHQDDKDIFQDAVNHGITYDPEGNPQTGITKHQYSYRVRTTHTTIPEGQEGHFTYSKWMPIDQGGFAQDSVSYDVFVDGKNVHSDVTNPSYEFIDIPSPKIKGYKLSDESQKTIDGATVGLGDLNKIINVVYIKDNPTPDPGNDNPTPNPDDQKSTPKDPKPTTPKTLKDPKNDIKPVTHHKKHGKKAKKHYRENFEAKSQNLSERNRKRTNANVTSLSGNPTANNNASSENNTAKQELPQTGENQNQLGLIGLALASIAGFLGLASDKKRKN